MKKIILFLTLLTCSATLLAGGYRVALQGQKAQGVANAGAATADDIETVFFNPAGLTYLEGTEYSFGLNMVEAQSNYQNIDLGSSASTDSPVSTPVNFYWGKPLSDNSALGFGIYTPFGSRVVWPQDWAGSHLVNEIELSAIFFQPTYAYQVNEKMSVGVGGIIALGGIEFNRNLSTSLSDENGNRTDVTLEDSGITEYGLSLGLQYELSEKTNLGVTYRTEITMTSNGDATFNDVSSALTAAYPDQSYEAELPLPAELTLGISHQIKDNMKLIADYNFVYWSAYESLDIDFETNSALLPDSVNPRNYKDSGVLRLGLEYVQSDKLTLRGGIYFDESPIQDGYFAPETPRGDSTGLTGGLSYRISDTMEFDTSLIILDFDQIDNSYDFSSEGSFAGSYTTSTTILGAGFTSRF